MWRWLIFYGVPLLGMFLLSGWLELVFIVLIVIAAFTAAVTGYNEVIWKWLNKESYSPWR